MKNIHLIYSSCQYALYPFGNPGKNCEAVSFSIAQTETDFQTKELPNMSLYNSLPQNKVVDFERSREKMDFFQFLGIWESKASTEERRFEFSTTDDETETVKNIMSLEFMLNKRVNQIITLLNI